MGKSKANFHFGKQMTNKISNPKVVIAGTHFRPCVQYLKNTCPEALIQMVEVKDLESSVKDCHILIPAIALIGERVFAQAPNLILVQQWGAGLEGVDIDAASRYRIPVANVPTSDSGNAESVAEWCVMAAICLSRRFPLIQEQVRTGHPWGAPEGRALFGRTAGLVGFGGIGKALAIRLRCFGMHIVCVKRYPDEALKEAYGLDWIGDTAALPRLLQVSDYLFICVPLTGETRDIISHKELLKLRAGSFLINPTRGPIVNRQALYEALVTGHLGGAALDVFWQEPPSPTDPILNLPNVLLTPHIAGVTDLSYSQIASSVSQNIRRIIAGKRPLNCVNPAVCR